MKEKRSKRSKRGKRRKKYRFVQFARKHSTKQTRHMRHVHLGTYQVFKCEQCPRSFDYKRNLTAHCKKRHTGHTEQKKIATKSSQKSPVARRGNRGNISFLINNTYSLCVKKE